MDDLPSMDLNLRSFPDAPGVDQPPTNAVLLLCRQGFPCFVKRVQENDSCSSPVLESLVSSRDVAVSLTDEDTLLFTYR
jgi:hypothetical protein